MSSGFDGMNVVLRRQVGEACSLLRFTRMQWLVWSSQLLVFWQQSSCDIKAGSAQLWFLHNGANASVEVPDQRLHRFTFTGRLFDMVLHVCQSLGKWEGPMQSVEHLHCPCHGDLRCTGHACLAVLWARLS